MNGENRMLLTQVGRTQIDGMFASQRAGPALDDSEFLPLIEIVLAAFEQTQGVEAVAVELWEYAFAVYDRMCKEDDPTFTSDENRTLMRSYLLGKRKTKRRRR